MKRAIGHLPATCIMVSLERRVMFSQTPLPPAAANPATVAADHAQLQTDIHQWQADQISASLLADTDANTLLLDEHAATLTLNPLKAQLQTDQAGYKAALAADNAAAAAVRNADLPAYTADVNHVHADRGNAAALVADQAKIAAAAQKFATDMAPYTAKINADITKWTAIFATDNAQIAAAAKAGAAKVYTDTIKSESDAAHWGHIVTADLKKISADQVKLQKDSTGQ
jgi:hypothetical protein